MSLLAIAPWVILALIQVTFAVVAILTRPNRKGQKDSGFKGPLTGDLVDLTQPAWLLYGSPIVELPLLSEGIVPEKVNSLGPVKNARAFRLLHGGIGPIDRLLSMWQGDDPLFDEVTADHPIGERRMIALDATLKRFFLPKDNIVPESLVVFEDGVLIGKGDMGGGLAQDVSFPKTHGGLLLERFSQNATENTVAGGLGSIVFQADRDLARFSTLSGAILPDRGEIQNLKVTIRFSGFQLGGTWTSASLYPRDENGVEVWRKRIALLPAADVIQGKLDDDRNYFYVRWAFPFKQYLSVGSTAPVSTPPVFDVTYDHAPEVATERDEFGRTIIVFEDAKTGLMTAQYRTSLLGDRFRVVVRKGLLHQEPLPIPGDGNLQTLFVDEELTVAVARTRTTGEEVDDILVGIQSGPAGFYDQAISGGNAGDLRTTHRKFRIRIRSTSAPDATTNGTDPKKGWVLLKDNNSGQQDFRVHGAQSGNPARWFFSLAQLLDFTKGRTPSEASRLTPDSYTVEVTALDGPHDLQRIQNDLFWGTVGELRTAQLINPLQVLYYLEWDDPNELESSDVIRAQARNRLVQNHETGDVEFSRNNIWAACDFFLNAHFGMGQNYKLANLNVPDAIAAAAFADATATNADGTTEPFSEIDTAITDYDSAWGILVELCFPAMVHPYMEGGILRFAIDRAGAVVQDPVNGGDFTITDEDISKSGIRLHHASLEEIPTELEISYNPEEQGYKRTSIPVREKGQPSRRSARPIDMTGTRRTTQVVRVGSILLQLMLRNTHELDILAEGWRFLLLQVGDIVLVTSERVGETLAKYVVVVKARGSNLRPTVLITPHEPLSYGLPFRGAVSSVPPGTRTPTDVDSATDPVLPEQFVIEKVAS